LTLFSANWYNRVGGGGRLLLEANGAVESYDVDKHFKVGGGIAKRLGSVPVPGSASQTSVCS